MIKVLNRWTGSLIHESLELVIAEHLKWLKREGGERADLRGSNLSGSNLSGSNLSGVPIIPNIHQVVYEAASKPNALDMSAWHSCETTHCRAGWVITLAGLDGRAMEYCLGTPAAAALIYIK